MNVLISAPSRALVIAALVFGSTGCSTSLASDAPDSGLASCGDSGRVGQSTPTVAVLGELGKATEYYAGDFNTVMNGAEELKARVIVSGVGSDNTAPSLLTNTVLVGDGANQLARTTNLDCKKALVQRSFDQTLHDRPNPQPIDAFGAIKTLEGNLSRTPKGAAINVVLFTSLMNTSRPVDLSAPGALNDPPVALNTLAAQRLLPDCRGWRVYAIGGDQQSQPPVDNATSAALREFWRVYFERCGGALVAWSTHLDTFPISGGGVAAADTEQVPVHRQPGKVTADLSGDVLFDPGSADLRSAADGQLNQVLALAAQSSGRIVIDGYTDVGGDEAANVDLSQRRCASIRAWLVRHGVSSIRIITIGRGSNNPRFSTPATGDQHQANRRVGVAIYGNA